MVKKLQKNRKLILYSCLTIAWIMVIFSFSMQSGEESSQISGGFVSRVLGIFLPADFVYTEQLEFLVRKMAHFAEYMVLGIFMSMTLQEAKINRCMLVGFLLCVFIASCDETIQLFSGGRSGKVADVILDSVGSLTGIVLIRIFYKWIDFYKRRNK